MGARSSKNNRREFLKKLGLTSLPFVLPSAVYSKEADQGNDPIRKKVNFRSDGMNFSPEEYIQKLTAINSTQTIAGDTYGNGGVTSALEEKCALLTGKEKAIYLPTGTMANQLAISLLNGENTKIIVPENSHIYRDEADAAQSVHAKRLVPVRNGKTYYDVNDLDRTIQELMSNEVFKSGIGTVVIENPVRRANGTAVPLEVIKEISAYCREMGYKLHLDAARIHMAEAFQGVSVQEYAKYFDTVYLSLYKYLNAAGGAILCGTEDLISQMPHQIKIHGGTMYQSWTNTAMALHHLEGISKRFQVMANAGSQLLKKLNSVEGIVVKGIPNATNCSIVSISPAISGYQFYEYLRDIHQIFIRPPSAKGEINFYINETVMFKELDEIVFAFEDALANN